MTEDQARALFNDHREPGDLAHYGEKAAVAAILAATQPVTLLEKTVRIGQALPAAESVDVVLAKLFPEWEVDQRQHIAFDCAVAALSATPTPLGMSDEVFRRAVANLLPIGNDRLPGNRVIPIYVRMDQLRALRELSRSRVPE